MFRRRTLLWALLLAGLIAPSGKATAGIFFGNGIGGAMYYGPYTGGHAYSYNVAYSYVLPFSPADTWRKDILAYPAGPYPYRPPVPLVRYFDRPPAYAPGAALEPLPDGAFSLQPVPHAAGPATVHVSVPATAEVWFEGEKTATGGAERVFRSPPLQPGKNYIYTVRARWNEAGRDFEQVQVVSVQAGSEARLSFPRGR